MEEATGPVRWEYPIKKGARGRRAEVGRGCFMLEHEATGRFFADSSDTVSKDVDKHLSQLALGKHRCKLLNELYSRDNVIKVHEFPADKEKQRVALLADLKRCVDKAPYLCLNPDKLAVKKRRKPKDKP